MRPQLPTAGEEKERGEGGRERESEWGARGREREVLRTIRDILVIGNGHHCQSVIGRARLLPSVRPRLMRLPFRRRVHLVRAGLARDEHVLIQGKPITRPSCWMELVCCLGSHFVYYRFTVHFATECPLPSTAG